MNSLFVLLGIESWKPLFAALLLPPVPFLLTAVIGTRLVFWRRTVGWLVVLLSVTAAWLGCCTAPATWLQRTLLPVPASLNEEAVTQLKREVASAGKKQPTTAIVVLGGGRQLLAPEYGLSNLNPASMERLRYGIWLARETGAPVAFSGGVGYGQAPGAAEAEIAGRIAAKEFGLALKWTETESRDTRENAAHTVALLRAAGVQKIVLVTHGFHMPRALRAFQQAGAAGEAPVSVVPAPIAVTLPQTRQSLRWMPTNEGIVHTRNVLREVMGLLFGA